MAPSDSTAPFLRIPWTAPLITAPNLVTRVPESRRPKPTTNEDSFFATTLKTPSTLRSCISVYSRPSPTDSHIPSISTFITLGSALDGHPGILHGGVVAGLLDEGMGILQSVNHERDHLVKVGKGFAEGESPATGLQSFTAYLNVRYLRPVRSAGAAVQVVAWYVRREGRKCWVNAEVRQNVGGGEDDGGEVVVCASAEGLFVLPRGVKL